MEEGLSCFLGARARRSIRLSGTNVGIVPGCWARRMHCWTAGTRASIPIGEVPSIKRWVETRPGNKEMFPGKRIYFQNAYKIVEFLE